MPQERWRRGPAARAVKHLDGSRPSGGPKDAVSIRVLLIPLKLYKLRWLGVVSLKGIVSHQPLSGREMQHGSATLRLGNCWSKAIGPFVVYPQAETRTPS